MSGSYKSEPCPPGTYSNTSGAANSQDCRECDPGYYCEKASGPSPEGPCYAGYYCKNGAVTPKQFEVQPGFYAPNGSSGQSPCQVGTYQPNSAQGKCLPCAPGHYCPTTQMKSTEPCPSGYYCPEGSEVQQYCVAGTYNNFTRRNLSTDCLPCPAGKFCDPASTLPTGI